MRQKSLLNSILLLALVLAFPLMAEAAMVGRVTQVQGRVDLLKKGNLPALTVAVGQEIGPGDVLRTKSLSKAQVKFIDDTVLDIGPESRIAIEEYLYDAAKGKRRAVLQVFRGLVHTLVTRILQAKEPDFIMKTNTSILGVRGTDWWASLGPMYTDFYNHCGTTCVCNIYPEVAGQVCMEGPQFCRVMENLTPTVPIDLQPGDFQPLLLLMNPRLSGQAGPGAGAGSGTSPGAVNTPSPFAPAGDTLGSGFTSSGELPNPTSLLGTGNGINSNISFIPPTQTVAALPPPSTYSFIQYYYGTQWSFAQTPSGYVQGMGWGFRTGVYDGYFTGYEDGVKTAAGGYSLPTANFDIVGIMTGSVTGVLGQTLQGQITSFTNQQGSPYTFTLSGPVTVTPDGKLTFTYSGSWYYSGLGSHTVAGAASGILTLYPGSYFSQSTSGTYQYNQQGPNQGAVVDSTPLSGTRSYAYPGAITQSLAFNLSSSSPLPASGSGDITVSTQGVLTGNGQDLSGVATTTSTLSGTLTKTVTTTGNIQGTATNMTALFSTNSPGGDSVQGAAVTVPSGSGQTTMAFAANASGPATLTQSGTDIITTGTTPLSGTMITSGGGSTPVNVDMNITNTLSSVSAGPVQLNANLVAAVAGPASGAKTGIVNLGASYSGGATANLRGTGPATLSATNVLTATATGLSPIPPHPVISTTNLTVTPK